MQRPDEEESFASGDARIWVSEFERRNEKNPKEAGYFRQVLVKNRR